ncbi:hypothetical protein L207DRAFT_42422 [Hyaloscypha variabilis F]|uniref:Uncharacterized protein n=1 Tax=Hyaloscypha variabilis (strain UAMH 11265 / GT02V1 / F) TaxID=1149755 RepID=A0A2J6RJH2_HYAVF|nr:hypothetical protein L207DRAFT_42422 [Hyaloscypha variabilis F]
MLNHIKSFLGRQAPPQPSRSTPPCTHPYCAHRTHCLKSVGEDSISQASLISFSSETQTLNTIISEHFSSHEVDIDYSWDSDDGWAVFCHRCQQERCEECGGGVFTQVTNFEDVLTFESREVWICSPCTHGKCPGSKMKILSMCGRCGHTACGECMTKGNEKSGVKCCQCAKEERKGDNQAIETHGIIATETEDGQLVTTSSERQANH